MERRAGTGARKPAEYFRFVCRFRGKKTSSVGLHLFSKREPCRRSTCHKYRYVCIQCTPSSVSSPLVGRASSTRVLYLGPFDRRRFGGFELERFEPARAHS